MKKIWVYDEENLLDFHCSVYIDRDSDDIRIFEISNFKNELKELQHFVKTEVGGLWGFNNNSYDDILLNYKLGLKSVTAQQLYEKSTSVINSDRQWNNLKIPSADVFKMLHFDRFGVSLKWCEYVMGSESIEEMPVEHWESVDTVELASKVVAYCKWDVLQTKKILKLHEGDVQIRRDLQVKYPEMKNVFSMSNTAMGKTSMLLDYCKITNTDPNIIKYQRTKRDSIVLGNIIDDRITFKTKPFQDFLTYLKNKKTNLVVNELDEYIYFQKMHYILKKGGLHGTEGQRIKKGKTYSVNTKYIYEANDEEKLLDVDFSSYYPFCIQVLGIAPKHLDKDTFIQLVSNYTSERVYHKNNGNEKEAAELKIKINALFGQMGDENSFLYDLEAMYKVTINGQLLLLMMIEELVRLGAHCWYANTDGCSFIVSNTIEDSILKKAQDFATWINIPLECDYFQKAYIKDVNNFCIIKPNGKLKLKGCYVYENIPMTKNPSNSISAKAAVQYLVHKTPIVKTIQEEKNILPFCIGKRAKKTSAGMPVFTWYESGLEEKAYPQQKTIRYIVSNRGGVLKSVYPNGKSEHLEAPLDKGRFWFTSIYNKLESYKVEDFDINWLYYQYEANKLCQFKKTTFQGQLNQLKLL